MTCLVCLGHKNSLYNLCNVCNNCMVCSSCYNTNQLNALDNCFTCRAPFIRVKRKKNMKDFWYFLHYFRYAFIFCVCMIFLPNFNTVFYFPEKEHMQRNTLVFHTIGPYLSLLNFTNGVIFPYLFYTYNRLHILFWIICLVNSIFTILYPSFNKEGQAYLYIFYNIVYIYTSCLLTFIITIYSELYTPYMMYVNDYIRYIKIVTSKIKIHKRYIRRQVQISPIQEHPF